MGFFQRLFAVPSAAMKSATPNFIDAVTADNNAVEWPAENEWPAVANGMVCRDYAVRIVTDFISRQIASLPFKVYRKDPDGGAHEVTDGPLAALLKQPSRLPGVSRYRFFGALMRDMLLEDKWVATVGYDRRADAYTLRRIPPGGYSLDANGFGEITKIRINPVEGNQGREISLPSPLVVMDVGYTDSLTVGEPVLDVLRPLLAEARAMSSYRRSIAEHGVQLPGYVYRPKEVEWESQEDYDAFVQGLRNYAAKGGRAGELITLRDGMEIRTLDNIFKPVDMADTEARQQINEEVALAFQISPENIGFRTGTNSNIAAYKEKLWNIELLPYLVAFEEALNRTLPEAVGEPGLYIRANLDAKLRGTMETQYQALSTATGRPFLTTNEARSLLDRPSLAEGDELITPLNVLQGGQPSPYDGGRTQAAQEGAEL